jgi:hypothetical protein
LKASDFIRGDLPKMFQLTLLTPTPAYTGTNAHSSFQVTNA